MTSFTVRKTVTLYAQRGTDRLPMCDIEVRAEISRDNLMGRWVADRIFIETTTRACVDYVPTYIRTEFELLAGVPEGEPFETLLYSAICDEIEKDQFALEEEYAASDAPRIGEYDYEEPDYV